MDEACFIFQLTWACWISCVSNNCSVFNIWPQRRNKDTTLYSKWPQMVIWKLTGIKLSYESYIHVEKKMLASQEVENKHTLFSTSLCSQHWMAWTIDSSAWFYKSNVFFIDYIACGVYFSCLYILAAYLYKCVCTYVFNHVQLSHIPEM